MDDSSEEYSSALMEELGNDADTSSEATEDTSTDEAVDTSSEGDGTPQEASGEVENQDAIQSKVEDEEGIDTRELVDIFYRTVDKLGLIVGGIDMGPDQGPIYYNIASKEVSKKIAKIKSDVGDI